MTWPTKYNLIDSEELISKTDQYLMNEDGTPKFPVISLDTETNGLALYKTSIVGISFSVDQYHGFYLPLLIWKSDPNSKKLRTKDGIKREVLTDGQLYCPWTDTYYDEFVKPQDVKYPDWVPAIIERWFGKTQLFAWNAPFDINHIFINFGIDLKNNLVVDGGLLTHILNENESVGLKETANRYAAQLGFNQYVLATAEKEELKGSIIRNGGTGTQVWRADIEPQMHYAAQDTMLTHGLIPLLLQDLYQERGEDYAQLESWIFDQEVMPLCKEVIIDLKRNGIFLDVPHFEKLRDQNAKKLIELEDNFILAITPYLKDFEKGKSLDEAISHQRLVKKIIELEGLELPQVLDKKTGETKESLAKAVVKKTYEETPHWIWGYILGQDEIKYSEAKLNKIKQELYEEVEGRRYRFNLGSSDHLVWLFFDKLKENRHLFEKTAGSTEEEWKPSLDADQIKTHLLPKYAWVNYLLKYKKILKIQSTYVEPALELHIDGWMRVDYKQNGTTSGRFSCAGGYNLQTLPRVEDEQEALEQCSKCNSKNIELDEYIECAANVICGDCGHIEHDITRPSAIKKGFIAPPGYKIVNADYASLEPRIFAYISEEPDIKKVYSDGLDLYSKVYCDMFDKAGQYSADPNAKNFLKKVYPKGRKLIKATVLGIPYGAGNAQVATMTGHTIKSTKPNKHGIYEERPDVAKGKELRDLYLATYPRLSYYMERMERQAVELGYVQCKYGRRRHFEWAKLIGDFLEQLPTKNDFHYDQMSKVNSLVQVSSTKLQGTSVDIKDINSGNIIWLLTEKNLEELCKVLNINFSVDKFGKDGCKQKGGWSYIKSLLKGDLNNAKNFPIQGLAGSVTNMGMLVTARLFKEHNIDGWIFTTVHDEIGCYVREDQAELGRELLQNGMENNIFTLPLANDVKMIAEPIICDNLRDSK
jgi:DNA polymerase I-like protein with 3'-5' exonuclease and polymerase domains